MAASKIRKGDTVQVIAGKDANKKGTVLKVLRDSDRVIVEGVNRVQRHTRVTEGQRGAKEGGGKSVGLGIHLPMEQEINDFCDVAIDFDYFFIRKMMFTKFAAGLVVAPGGFGTMDELFDTLTLIQTRKIRRVPVVLLGTSYFGPLVGWMQDVLLQEGAISPGDLDLWLLTDEPAAAAAYLDRHVVDQTWWSQPTP